MILKNICLSSVAALTLVTGCSSTFDTRSQNAAAAEQRSVEQIMNDGSPWATTGVFLLIDGETDRAVNFIEDPEISAGTISSAQYRDGRFVFIGLNDFTTGELNTDSPIEALNADTASGFSFGDFEIIDNGADNIVRRLTNASFAPDAVIDRRLTTVTPDEFTYSFERDGNTYHVEHKPYEQAFPGMVYPANLQTAVDGFFTRR